MWKPWSTGRTPSACRLDLNLSKRIGSSDPDIRIVLDVINVFNQKNVISVWQSSGRPDDTGWLQTEAGQDWLAGDPGPDWTGLDREEKYQMKENNPLNYDTPRQIRLGMRVHF